jgi:hypothetical protein
VYGEWGNHQFVVSTFIPRVRAAGGVTGVTGVKVTVAVMGYSYEL